MILDGIEPADRADHELVVGNTPLSPQLNVLPRMEPVGIDSVRYALEFSFRNANRYFEPAV